MSEYAELQLRSIAASLETLVEMAHEGQKESEINYSDAGVHMFYAQQIAEAIESNGADMFDLLKRFRKIESQARQTAEALIQ